MNPVFEIGVPLALVLGAWFALYLVRRYGERMDRMDEFEDRR